MSNEGNLFVAELTLKPGSEAAVKMRDSGWRVDDFECRNVDDLTFMYAKNCFAVLVDDTEGDKWRVYRMPEGVTR